MEGEVQVAGAKNATLPLIAAGLLSPGVSKLSNVPGLRDVDSMLQLLGEMGVTWELENGTATIDAGDPLKPEAPYDLVRKMRASVLVLGPLVARCGSAKVSLPGGCAIGARPINLHLTGLEKLGAEISISGGYVHARADRLKGTYIQLDFPTVTGTENLMMAATLAEGRTLIENAAREPEVTELAEALNSMGANVRGAGTELLVIDGVDELQPYEHRVRPDRIEAGTYLMAAAATGGDVLVRDCPEDRLGVVLDKLRMVGAEVTVEGPDVRVRMDGRAQPADVHTRPYPGFPTDMQAQYMALMALTSGRAVITENVFENRFMHVSELRRMGADIESQGNAAVVRGIERLSGAPVMATDLRASACLVVAGLAAEGVTEIRRIYHLDRGYEQIETKLAPLGARIQRVPG